MADKDSDKPKSGFSDIADDDRFSSEAKPASASEKSSSMPFTIGGLVVACWAALFLTGSASTATVVGLAVISLAAAAVIYRHFKL